MAPSRQHFAGTDKENYQFLIMISHSQIIKLASNLGLPEETIEKDYFIELLLSRIAENKESNNLIFRGGTALKKIYFPDYRYSEDIDFLTRDDLKDFLKNLTDTAKRLNRDFPAEAEVKGEFLKEGRLQMLIGYNIDPEISAVKELKIDILRDNYLPPHRKRKVKFSYPDLKDSNVRLLVYDLESILADKISRILDVVNEPRDVYDIWFLLKLKLDFPKVKRIFKEKMGFEFNFKNLLSEIQKEEYRTNWRIRLSQQIPNLPDFEETINDLKILIKEKF